MPIRIANPTAKLRIMTNPARAVAYRPHARAGEGASGHSAGRARGGAVGVYNAIGGGAASAAHLLTDFFRLGAPFKAALGGIFRPEERLIG